MNLGDGRAIGFSYWDHNCAVIGIQDVLEHDIPGSDVKARLKRWWWDLFLLSNRRAHTRVVYSSSHALRLERLRHYRLFKYMIHPLSRFKHSWDIWMLQMLIIYDFFFHINTSLLYGDITIVSYIINAVIEIIRIIDIIINMFTGYINKETRRVVLDRHQVSTEYGKTKLFFHVISAIPHTWLMFIRYRGEIVCALCKGNKFIGTLKYLNLFNLFRIYELSIIIIKDKRASHLYFKLLRITVLGVMTMLQFRELTDISILYTMLAQNFIVPYSRIGIALIIKYVKIKDSYKSTFELCVYDVTRMLKLFFVYSIHPGVEYIMDHLVSLTGMVISKLFYLWTIVDCYCHMASKMYPQDNVIRMEESTIDMIRNRQLSDTLADKIRRNYDYNMAHLRMIRYTNKIIRALPAVIRQDSLLENYTLHISRIPFFSMWPDKVIIDMVLMIKEKVFQINDCLSEPWLQSEGLHVVVYGELAVYNEIEETSHLIDGDYFDELSLVTDEDISTVLIIAIKPTLVIVLNKIAFRAYMRDYPELFIALRNYLLKKHNAKQPMTENTESTSDATNPHN